MRRSTVLCLPLQLVLPGQILQLFLEWCLCLILLLNHKSLSKTFLPNFCSFFATARWLIFAYLGYSIFFSPGISISADEGPCRTICSLLCLDLSFPLIYSIFPFSLFCLLFTLSPSLSYWSSYSLSLYFVFFCAFLPFVFLSLSHPFVFSLCLSFSVICFLSFSICLSSFCLSVYAFQPLYSSVLLYLHLKV